MLFQMKYGEGRRTQACYVIQAGRTELNGRKGAETNQRVWHGHPECKQCEERVDETTFNIVV